MHRLAESRLLGSLLGVLVSLLGVLAVTNAARSGHSPRETVSEIIVRDVEAFQRTTSAPPKDDGRLRVYVMAPQAQPPRPVHGPAVRPPIPRSPRPAPPGPVPEPGPQARDVLEIMSVTARFVEMTQTGQRQEWTLIVRNPGGSAVRFGATIKFLNEHGRITHTCHVRNLTAEPDSSSTFQGSLIIDPSLPPNPASVEVEIL